MVALNDYVIPFAVCDGLVYMDMHPPTDAEFNEGPTQLPQLVLTSDQKWIPSCIDSEPNYDTCFDAVSDLKTISTAYPLMTMGSIFMTQILQLYAMTPTLVMT